VPHAWAGGLILVGTLLMAGAGSFMMRRNMLDSQPGVGLGMLVPRAASAPIESAQHAIAGARADAPAAPAATTVLQPLDPGMWAEIEGDWEAAASDDSTRALNGLGVELFVPRVQSLDIDGKLRGQRPAAEQVKAAASSLQTLLSIYPRTLLSRLGLQRVLLLDALQYRGARAGAFAIGRAGVLVIEPVSLDDVFRVHHEIFHFADYRLYGYPAHSPGWSELSPPHARYAAGPRSMLGIRDVSGPRTDLPGFVTAYAQSSPVEDRAEVFATWLVRKQFAMERRAVDPVIAAKARYVLDALDSLDPGVTQALGLR
jgi:hypothetical protein